MFYLENTIKTLKSKNLLNIFMKVLIPFTPGKWDFKAYQKAP